jgi:hypothetical protein
MARGKDITNMKFSNLLVVKKLYVLNKRDKKMWLCICDCGKETTAYSSDLFRGYKKSCGCLKVSRMIEMSTKHGLKKHSLYIAWINMRERCRRKNLSQYKDYGGRGIKICDEWRNDFMAFYNWSIANGWKKGLTIDRIDNNGHYDPSNCRFVDRITQCRNQRSNVLITYGGRTLCVSEWASILGLSGSTLRNRISILKWDLNKAFTTPLQKPSKL